MEFKMKILIVHSDRLSEYPPTISLIQNLLSNCHNVTVISEDIEKLPSAICDNGNFKGIKVPPRFEKERAKHIKNLIWRQIHLRKIVACEMEKNDLLWTTTAISAKDIGKDIYKYKHIMQLMELVKDIPVISTQMVFMAHIDRIARNAYKVVVAEDNRAYIQQAWWNLDEKPCVLPNKPYLAENIVTTLEDKISRKLQKEKRKIILYQGVFSSDRRLDKFAEAIDQLGTNQYAFYMIGKESPMRQELCRKYPFIEYLGFITPPNHLKVAEYAYIGLLPYIPDKSIPYINSELNAVYCAPNKIYEYAMCNLPMIGTDVPGLRYPFEKYDIGVCCKHLEIKDIIEAIQYVEANHERLSRNCQRFFNDINLDKIVEDIIS